MVTCTLLQAPSQCAALKAGQELTISYIDHSQPCSARRLALRTSFLFLCECDRWHLCARHMHRSSRTALCCGMPLR